MNLLTFPNVISHWWYLDGVAFVSKVFPAAMVRGAGVNDMESVSCLHVPYNQVHINKTQSKLCVTQIMTP